MVEGGRANVKWFTKWLSSTYFISIFWVVCLFIFIGLVIAYLSPTYLFYSIWFDSIMFHLCLFVFCFCSQGFLFAWCWHLLWLHQWRQDLPAGGGLATVLGKWTVVITAPHPRPVVPRWVLGQVGIWVMSCDMSERTKHDVAHVPKALWDMGHFSDTLLLELSWFGTCSSPNW